MKRDAHGATTMTEFERAGDVKPPPTKPTAALHRGITLRWRRKGNTDSTTFAIETKSSREENG
jgi:hypothetical protein